MNPALLRGYSSVVGLLFVLALASLCAACQTFSLSDEDFRKQQLGQMLDRQVGDAVAALGSAAYFVGGIAAAAAAGFK